MIYQAGNVLYRRATEADQKELQRILDDNPMDGWVRLCMNRTPAYFSMPGLMGHSHPVIAVDQGDSAGIVGMYECGFAPVWINGVAAHAGYLGALRVYRRYRHRLRVLRNGFASIPELFASEIAEISAWFTSIVSDNRTARRTLEAGLKGMPHYRPNGELETLALSARKAKRFGLLRTATEQDIPALVAFHRRLAVSYQYAPRLEKNWLGSLSDANGLRVDDFLLLEIDGEILGCIAVWDQRALKRMIVSGYRSPLNQLRPIHNGFARFRGKPLLPKPGAELKSIFLSFFNCVPEASEYAARMVQEALYRVQLRGGELGLLGLSVESPLLEIVRSALPAVAYRSCVDDVGLPVAKPTVLDSRPTQPEIALL